VVTNEARLSVGLELKDTVLYISSDGVTPAPNDVNITGGDGQTIFIIATVPINDYAV
jgi:hypothetical protein